MRDWIVLDAKDFVCLRCGARVAVGFPIGVAAFGRLAGEFIKIHRVCLPPSRNV